MKIAVIGAGAIGNVVAGYLTLNNETVYLIGRARTVEMIKKNGLLISGTRGETRVNLEASERLRDKPDVAILAVKTQDLEEALEDNHAFSQRNLFTHYSKWSTCRLSCCTALP